MTLEGPTRAMRGVPVLGLVPPPGYWRTRRDVDGLAMVLAGESMSTIWHATVMADYYETLAADYDWLFDNDALADGLAITIPRRRACWRGPVRQCRAGRGLWHRPHAAALARRGYRVAADGSDAMVEMAAARFRREHLEIPLVRCMWADLPAASTNGSTSCSASGTHSCTPPAAMP